MNKKLWVDDERPVPDDSWDHAVCYKQAIQALKWVSYEELSLDHDIASFEEGKEKTGYDIALWLAERRERGVYVPKVIRCHSANPVGRQRIEGVVERYLK